MAFRIADIGMQADIGRTAYLRAAWLAQECKPFKEEAAAVKLSTTEYRVGRFYQDAKILEMARTVPRRSA